VLPLAASVLVMLGVGYLFFRSNPVVKQNTNVVTTATKPQETIVQSVPETIIKQRDKVAHEKDSRIAFQGNPVTDVKLNGKDFAGGDVTQATKNLPADILEKIQVVDDYGDQAAKTGNPTKALNVVTDTLNKTNLVAVNRPQQQLMEVSVAPPVNERSVASRVARPGTDRTVTGKVLDQQGAPLIGATVKVDGTDKAVNTDVNGDFKIEMPANKDLLAVLYVGYTPQQIKVGDQNNLNIGLKVDEANLNEVVVVGYGTQKKRSVTGSSTICKENLKFKAKFFDQIALVEKYTNEQVTSTKHTVKENAFKKALEFIRKYTKTSTGDTYTDMAAFQADKKQWLNWYEVNKCNNLK
jgi:hypothetical protein